MNKGLRVTPKRLYDAMEPLLPNWNKYDDRRVSASTVCGVPDEWNNDPRLSAKQWMDNEGNLTLQMMIGTTQEGAGRWVSQSYTPEQCVQIVAAILSRPAMTPAVGPLLEALARFYPPSDTSETSGDDVGGGR